LTTDKRAVAHEFGAAFGKKGGEIVAVDDDSHNARLPTVKFDAAIGWNAGSTWD
jgi:hypothetical protein